MSKPVLVKRTYTILASSDVKIKKKAKKEKISANIIVRNIFKKAL